MASFIEIHAFSKEISRHDIQVLTDEQWTYGQRTDGRPGSQS